jgi:hypothetical protein
MSLIGRLRDKLVSERPSLHTPVDPNATVAALQHRRQAQECREKNDLGGD